MNNTVPFLQDEEIRDLFENLAKKLLGESDRGAIIIGATYIEDQLSFLIDKTLPSDENKKYRNRLFKYPGPLSSFSAKIELSYAFRLIDKNLYNSLNILRQIRNKAAHVSEEFQLKNYENERTEMLSFGPSIPIQVRNIITEFLVKLSLNDLNEVFNKHNAPEELREQILRENLENGNLEDSVNNQIPHWELIYGLSLIAGLIKFNRIQVETVLEENKTWAGLLKKLNESNDKTE